MDPPTWDTDVRTREITMEEVVRHQIRTIGWLRSHGLPWDEAVFELRDMVTGLEDETFERQWEEMPMRAVQGPKGEPLYRPTAKDLSRAYRLILGLLSRKGVTWRQRRKAFLGPLTDDE